MEAQNRRREITSLQAMFHKFLLEVIRAQAAEDKFEKPTPRLFYNKIIKNYETFADIGLDWKRMRDKMRCLQARFKRSREDFELDLVSGAISYVVAEPGEADSSNIFQLAPKKQHRQPVNKIKTAHELDQYHLIFRFQVLSNFIEGKGVYIGDEFNSREIEEKPRLMDKFDKVAHKKEKFNLKIERLKEEIRLKELQLKYEYKLRKLELKLKYNRK